MANFSNLIYTLIAFHDIDEGRVLKLNASGEAEYAGAADDPAVTPLVVSVGKAAAGQPVSVKPLKGGDLTAVVSSGSIGVGADVYLAANGKVAASGTYAVGRAIVASSADEYSYFVSI